MTAEKTTMAFGRRVYGLGVMAFGMGLPGVGGLRPGAALLVHGQCSSPIPRAIRS
jgi:hypothetical protein